MPTKEIGWNDGSGENIVLSAAEWRGDQTVHIQVGENFGPTREANIIFYSSDTSKSAAVQVQQQPYAISADMTGVTWEDTENDERKIVLITNGTVLNNFKAVISGRDADKFTVGAPVEVAATNTQTQYELSITPTGVNNTDTDYEAELNISSGLRNFIAFSISLTHKGVSIVSTTYEDFKAVYTVVPASGSIPASGTTLTLKLSSVVMTVRNTMSNGTVRTEYNVPYPNMPTTIWHANIEFGNPSRASFTDVVSSQSGGEVSFNLVIPSLDTTPYTNTDSTYRVTLWPEGQTSADSTQYSYTWGGDIQNNVAVTSYGDIEILNTPEWTISNGVAVVDSQEHNLIAYLGCQRTVAWTSGAVSTNDVQVFGDGSESGIQNEVIPESEDDDSTMPPITGWATGTLQWPVAFNGRNTTQLTLTVTSNVYYTRTFVGKWKTTA